MEQGDLQADVVVGRLGLFAALLLQRFGVLALFRVKRSPAEKEPHDLFSRKFEAGSEKRGGE